MRANRVSHSHSTVTIGTRIIEPKPNIRVLGLQIDTKLRWDAQLRETQRKMVKPQLRETQRKMAKQSMALTKISTSTWGATFLKSRQVYSAVVRPAMTYGSTIWHMPKDIKKLKTSTEKLSIMQNKCLRTIARRGFQSHAYPSP